jgi:hypothetical protein
MRARHLLAESLVLLLVGFAAFAQGPEGNGTRGTPQGEESSASSTNSTTARADSTAPGVTLSSSASAASNADQQQKQQNNSDKDSAASSSKGTNGSPAATPVASAGAADENADDTSNDITPGEKANIAAGQTLGDAARKNREEKKANAPATPAKKQKVFTNDDIDESGGLNIVGTPAANPAASDATAAKPSGSLADQEKEWRAKFAKAHAKLQRDQAELDVDQRELGKLQVQFYPNDPAKQLGQSLTNADVHNQQEKIDKDKQTIQNDQNDISNLEDELRKSGGDSGWARP